MDNLTTLERDLLLRLCENRVTLSAVMVAAEWWEKPGDPDYSLVVWMLEGLGERGLITYRINPNTYGVPIYIRVTPKGYIEAGFVTHFAVDIGRKRRSYKGEPAKDARDLTDFRNHGEEAAWAPVERMPIADHLLEYPTHRLNKGRFFYGTQYPCGDNGPNRVQDAGQSSDRSRLDIRQEQ